VTDPTFNEILWFQSLEEAIEDGDTESALQVVRAAIKLRRRMKMKSKKEIGDAFMEFAEKELGLTFIDVTESVEQPPCNCERYLHDCQFEYKAEKGGTRSPEDPGSIDTGEGGPDTVEN
jgi:hypothetical protein